MPREAAPLESSSRATTHRESATPDLAAVRAKVHERFLAERRCSPTSEVLDATSVRARVVELLSRLAPLLAPAVALDLVERLTADIAGLGPLEALLSDPTVDEVMVNGPDSVWVERRGVVERMAVRIDAETIARCIDRIISPLGLRLDRTSPYVDARLSDGSRLNAVIAPLAVDGPYLTIRRFASSVLEIEDFCASDMADNLRRLVCAGRSIIVSGGTGSGKTTLLNALASAIPERTRVVTIEDTAELRLPTAHVVRLEARAPTAEGVGGVSVRDLVRNALRMRPDRIIVGEVRGAEALDMVQAMSTGHSGSMSTVHANGPEDALRRLEVMILFAGLELPLSAVRRLITHAVDFVVHVERTGGASRRITEIRPVVPVSGPDDARRGSVVAA